MCCAYRNVFDLEQAKQQQFAFYAAYFLCTNTKFTIKWCMKNMIRMPFTLHITIVLMCHIQMCVFLLLINMATERRICLSLTFLYIFCILYSVALKFNSNGCTFCVHIHNFPQLRLKIC